MVSDYTPPPVTQATLKGAPSVTVSPVGLAQGLPRNNNANYGPDTPGTTTCGINEAAVSLGSVGGKLCLLEGTFTVSSTVFIPPRVAVIGAGRGSTVITSATPGIGYMVTLNAATDSEISGVTLDMNDIAGASALFFTGACSRIRVHNCIFKGQYDTWLIQFNSNGLSSSSPPTAYCQDVRIDHNEIFGGCSKSGGSLENVILSAAVNCYVDDNTIYVNQVSESMYICAFYDYTRGCRFGDNRILVAQNIGGIFYDSDGLFNDFAENYIETRTGSTNAIGQVVKLLTASIGLSVRGNVVNGLNGYGPNANTVGQFINIVSAPAPAVVNGSGGPDGNVSQNAGYVDYLIVEGNCVVGAYTILTIMGSQNQVANSWTFKNNVWATLAATAFDNGGTLRGFSCIGGIGGQIDYSNNTDISDLLVLNSSNVGVGIGIAVFSGWSTATINGNRFAIAKNNVAGSSYNNVQLSSITNLQFRGNVIGGSGTATLIGYYSLTSIGAGLVEGNIRGDTGHPLNQGFSVTTPAFPATATNVQNTNPFSVRIYLLTAGAGTAFTITDPAGNVQAITVALAAGMEFTLDPGAQIQFTYTTAPTWKWYGI